MAYGLKYFFKISSLNGAEVRIDVLKDGYNGTAVQRPLGAAPVLRQQKNDRVCGSSLAFSPECHVDGEFTEFYTTDPFKYRVDLYRASTKIWSGFITPELYSEPDIAPPYDVNVTATDGLGELRRTDFQPLGKVTLHALFTSLLSHTGQSLDVNYITRIGYTNVAYNAFFINTYINVDYKAGETCYDVLQYLLTTFNAVICYYNGAWLIARENDVTLTSGKPDYVNASGQAASFTGGHMEIGSMSVPGKLWPVNFTSSSVDPALRRMVVEAPWNLVSGLLNSGMTSDASWTKSQYTTYESSAQGYLLMPYNTLSQSMTQLLGKPLLLTFDAAMYLYGEYLRKPYSEAEVSVTFVVGNSTYSLATDDKGGIYWDASGTTTIDYKIESGTDRATAEENQITIPVFLDSNGDPVSGTLTVKFSAGHYTGEAGTQGLWLFGAWLTCAAEKGWKDSIEIDNGARGDATDVEIAIGYETSDIADYKKFYGGILLTGNDALVTSLSTQNFSGLDFLSLISRDFARSIASPRLRTTGTLDTPSTLVLRPLLLTHRGTLRWLETFEWNLYMDDMDFAAVSVPTGSITVGDEVITATGSASGSPDKTIGRLTPGSGEEGEDGITIMLGNYAHNFAASASGYAIYATDTIAVMAFRGSTAVATTVGTISGTISGKLSATKVNNGGTNTSIVVTATASLNENGYLSIPVTADGVTVTLRYGWTLTAKGADGQPGAPGAPGPATDYPFRGMWDENEYYYGTSDRRDIVKYNDVYYRAKADVGEIHEDTTPDQSSNWEAFGQSYSSVATDFLFTPGAVIANAVVQILRTMDEGSGKITVEGNALSMFDSNGSLKLKISGDDVAPAGTPTTLTVPTTAGALTDVSDTDALSGYTYETSGTIGTLSPTSASNVVSIPQITCRLRMSGRVDSGSVRGRATLAITVDGIPVTSAVSMWVSRTSSSGTYADSDFNIPATDLSLSVGSHTIGYMLTLEAAARTGYESRNGEVALQAFVNQAATISMGYASQVTEFGPNGMRVMLGSNELFQCLKTNGSSQFLLQCGNYGVEVTSSALKLRIGGTWYTAGTATISGNTVLKLT